MPDPRLSCLKTLQPSEKAEHPGPELFSHPCVDEETLNESWVWLHLDPRHASIERGVHIVDASVECVHRRQDHEIRRQTRLSARGYVEADSAFGLLDVRQ